MEEEEEEEGKKKGAAAFGAGGGREKRARRRNRRTTERKGGASQKRASGLRQRQPVGPDVIWDSPEANYRNREGRVRTEAYSVHGVCMWSGPAAGLVDPLRLSLRESPLVEWRREYRGPEK